jgi:hypothetical protein
LTVGRVDTGAFEQIKCHPAFYAYLTETCAEKLLIGTEQMTYILWTLIRKEGEAIVEQHCLSYMNSDVKVAHLILSSHHAAALSDLIPQIMQCQPKECKMLLNLHQVRKLSC